MEISSKLIIPESFLSICSKIKVQRKRLVHCHGVFDLLHPGHIEHLQKAKALGDILIVTVTDDPFVNKGPGRPYFTAQLRMASLAALDCVDYVMLSTAKTAEEVITVIQPDIFAKGQEYADTANDVTGKIDIEAALVRKLGGEVVFTDGIVFSSSKLLNNAFPTMPENVKLYLKDFAARYSFAGLRDGLEAKQGVRVLVVGDIIIDEYLFCNVQGLISKAHGLSARYQREERYLGGALAVARHLSGFSQHVTVCGLVGNEPHIHTQLLADMSGKMKLDLQFENNFTTVVKRRFVQRHGIRDDYDKLFSISYLGEELAVNKVDRLPFYSRLETAVSENDLVVIVDYGHGLVDDTVMAILQDKAKFLSINCQTNSTNYGTNLITKYSRADAFTLDQREIQLAFADRLTPEKELLEKLAAKLGSQQGWLTQGSQGATGIDSNLAMHTCPALTLKVKDTMGAGDAFFALASLCACGNDPVEVGTFWGNIAGGLAANTIGNAQPVGKEETLKFAMTMLKI